MVIYIRSLRLLIVFRFRFTAWTRVVYNLNLLHLGYESYCYIYWQDTPYMETSAISHLMTWSTIGIQL